MTEDVPAALSASLKALLDAARSGDPTSAAPFATPAGWESRADSARRLVKQVAMDGLAVRLTGPAFVTPGQERAAVRADVLEGDTVADTIWVLFRNTDGWKVEGQAQDRTVVGLFLGDRFSPVTELWDLPEDPDGAAWAQAHAKDLCNGDTCGVTEDELLEQGFTDVRVEQVVALEAVDRIGAIFEFRNPDGGARSRMSVLQRTPGGEVVPVEHGRMPGISALVDGVDVSWDQDLSGSSVADRVDKLLSVAMGQLLRILGVDPEAMPEGYGGALTRFLTQASSEGGLPQAALMDPALLDRAMGGDLAHKIERRAQQQVARVLREQGVDPSALDPDSEAGQKALAEHAPLIVRTLFGAVLLGVAPAEPAEELPEPVPAVKPWVQAALAFVATQQQGQA